ncbi:hepatic and glial cell adhesion molecule-like isoform X2 [Scyliorhinus torazame]|uniref:hepatic and glial cell adhesion molecule-like isoform X2 n=1 Tax=Scyliorhinus torazame TaxID=75743 RepID=UPI003B5AFA8C
MDIRQTLPLVIIGIILLLTGVGLCLNVKLKEGNIYGISGQSINLEATYLVESSNKLHSITWKVDKAGPTRILQYIISKNKTLTSTPYRNRIRFDSNTGSLILLDFTPSDRGTYQIIVTADDGAEDKASTEVTLYASSNVPQCRVDLRTNKRQHYIIPILIVTFSTLLTGLVIYSTKVGKIALQKSRSK